MPTTCAFQLDRLNPIYNSGEHIKGQIFLKTNKSKRVNAVYVSLEGEANVQWAISGKETASYFGHQQYLYSRASVFGSAEFAAGNHVYMLTLHIPLDCPSSCEGPYGYIAYHISLVIDKPHCFNEVFRQPIYVIQTLDLNIKPEFALPINEEKIKYLCQWPCSSGPLFFKLMLPYAGYTPGQYIGYVLEVDNQSPHYDVWSIEASLKQHFVFLARKPLKRNYHTRTLSKHHVEERTLRLTKRLYEGSVYVPINTPRSTLNRNYIVFLHYSLKIKLKTGLFHYDTEISVPVVIGTEPILRFLEDQHYLQTQHQHRNSNRNNNAVARLRNSDRGVITTQPSRLHHRLNNFTLDVSAEAGEVNHISPDEPPAYDTCLPPSFSYAKFMDTEASTDHSDEGKYSENQQLTDHNKTITIYNTFDTTDFNNTLRGNHPKRGNSVNKQSHNLWSMATAEAMFHTLDELNVHKFKFSEIAPHEEIETDSSDDCQEVHTSDI